MLIALTCSMLTSYMFEYTLNCAAVETVGAHFSGCLKYYLMIEPHFDLLTTLHGASEALCIIRICLHLRGCSIHFSGYSGLHYANG